MRREIESPTVCIFAGDVSGDQNGARLAMALRDLAPGIRLIGAGGAAMRAADVEVEVDTIDYSFVGVLSTWRFLPSLFARYRRVQQLVRKVKPDLVVLIDSESVAVRLAKWLRPQGIDVVFFFPPQVWFWGRWRLRGIVPLAKLVLSAFAEEAKLYRAGGAPAVWVGHPLRDAVRVEEDPTAAMRRVGLDPARPLVVLMPGSRRQEIRVLAARFLAAAKQLRSRDPRLQFAIPLASEALRADLEQAIAESGLTDVRVYRPDSYAILSRARVVIQGSGTATLETALLGIPSVIAYRCIPVEYLLARHVLMRVRFIGMVNILLDEMVQPEFFNKDLDADHLAAEAWSLLTDETRRRKIQSRLAELPALLGANGVMHRAAGEILELLPASARAFVARQPAAAARP